MTNFLAESLSAPIYLHPTKPPKPVIEASFGGFAPLVTEMLAGPGFGWHIETAVHVLRMVPGGVFDRFPKLQIVIGHISEGLPFFMQRVDVMPVELTRLKRHVSAYLRDNLHYTFAGFNFPPTFLDLLLEISVASCSRPTILMAQWQRHARFGAVSGFRRRSFADSTWQCRELVQTSVPVLNALLS